MLLFLFRFCFCFLFLSRSNKCVNDIIAFSVFRSFVLLVGLSIKKDVCVVGCFVCLSIKKELSQ